MNKSGSDLAAQISESHAVAPPAGPELDRTGVVPGAVRGQSASCTCLMSIDTDIARMLAVRTAACELCRKTKVPGLDDPGATVLASRPRALCAIAGCECGTTTTTMMEVITLASTSRACEARRHRRARLRPGGRRHQYTPAVLCWILPLRTPMSNIYEQPAYPGALALADAIEANDSAVLAPMIIAAALYEGNLDVAYGACVRLSAHADEVVRGNAIVGLGHLARRFGRLGLEAATIVERGLADRSIYVRGQANAAAGDLRHFLAIEGRDVE